VKYRIHKKIYSLYLLIVLIIFFTGCTSNITPIFPTTTGGPTSGIISIESGVETTFDRTPSLTVYSEGAAYMSFSGDGTFYEDFNIANDLYGTEFSSGLKYIYVRFKDKNEKLSPSDNFAYDTINYEFKDLNSIKIFPSEITIKIGSQYTFEVKGYDIDSNEGAGAKIMVVNE